MRDHFKWSVDTLIINMTEPSGRLPSHITHNIHGSKKAHCTSHYTEWKKTPEHTTIHCRAETFNLLYINKAINSAVIFFLLFSVFLCTKYTWTIEHFFALLGIVCPYYNFKRERNKIHLEWHVSRVDALFKLRCLKMRHFYSSMVIIIINI